MTSSRKHVSLGVEELHVCECQSFPHWRVSVVSVLMDVESRHSLFSHSAMTRILSPALPPADRYETGGCPSAVAVGSKQDIARSFTVQVGRDTRGVKSHGCHGKRASKINHTSDRSAVQDIQPVLCGVSLFSSAYSNCNVCPLTVCCLCIWRSNVTLPGPAATTRNCNDNRRKYTSRRAETSQPDLSHIIVS